MRNWSERLKTQVYLLITLLFVYLILFEFVLPVNKVLPKPSLLLESFLIIWDDYSLLSSLALTTTIIYLSLLIASIIVYYFAGLIVRISMEFPSTNILFQLFKYFPAFFFAIIFVYWFGNSFWAELLFSFCVSIFFFKKRIFELSGSINNNYLTIAKNLGMSDNEIFTNVIRKSILPELFNTVTPIHNYLWIIILIYEFIANSDGLGGVYNTALLYNDFITLFSIAIMISLLIWFGNSVIKFINRKIFFWEAE